MSSDQDDSGNNMDLELPDNSHEGSDGDVNEIHPIVIANLAPNNLDNDANIPLLENNPIAQGINPFLHNADLDDSDYSDDYNDPNENVQNDVVFFEDDSAEDGDAVSDASHSDLSRDRDENEANEDDDSPSPEFDPELPIRHTYLGEAMETLQGRVVLEDESVQEIPLVVMGLHLVPGQTLPMTVFHAVFQNAIRRCVVNDRVFGIVSTSMENIDGRTMVNRGSLGTLAEIYEFQEESEDHNPMQPLGSSFAIKAKGRQRFNVLEIRRQADGNLMGKVKIRPEIKLPALMYEIISHQSLRYSFQLNEPHKNGVEVESESAAAGDNRPNTGDAKTEESVYEAALNALSLENEARKRICHYYSRQTPFPSFVYANFDERILVERVHKMLKHELKGIVESQQNIPLDATDLSFWLAQNLTMDDAIRLQLLKMDSAIQRLRFELNLLENVSRVISCRRCELSVADHSDIFAMSIEGPQGTYVNPGGYVHETLTVHRARDIVTRGHPSTEASWFPGYSWTIVECRGCRSHLGWKFLATGRMNPKKFWGLARKAVTFKYDLTSDPDDLLERRASTASTASATTNADPNERTLTLPPLMEPPHDDN